VGIKVSVVEVKDVEIPQQMQRAMARQAESERERRAKIIAAEGEYQASQRLRQAADRLESPTALQLRLFQTMGEIAVNQNSTIVLPVPIDLFRPFLESQNGTYGQGVRAARREEEREAEREAERLYEEAVGDAAREVSDEAVPDGSPRGEARARRRAGLGPEESRAAALQNGVGGGVTLGLHLDGRCTRSGRSGPNARGSGSRVGQMVGYRLARIHLGKTKLEVAEAWSAGRSRVFARGPDMERSDGAGDQPKASDEGIGFLEPSR
jgi:hypothetical protein